MKRTEAMDRAIKKYESEKIDRVIIRMPKGNRSRIQNHATSCGESMNSFINRAIEETMTRDQKKSEDSN